MKKLNKRHKKKFDYFKNIGDTTIAKFKEQKDDLMTYCMEELQGCERIYGLMFIFTVMEDKMDYEEKELIATCTALIIGDMLEMDTHFANSMCNNIVDMFYSFDKLTEGYLVTTNFDEMKRYLKMRDEGVQASYN